MYPIAVSTRQSRWSPSIVRLQRGHFARAATKLDAQSGLPNWRSPENARYGPLGPSSRYRCGGPRQGRHTWCLMMSKRRRAQSLRATGADRESITDLRGSRSVGIEQRPHTVILRVQTVERLQNQAARSVTGMGMMPKVQASSARTMKTEKVKELLQSASLGPERAPSSRWRAHAETMMMNTAGRFHLSALWPATAKVTEVVLDAGAGVRLVAQKGIPDRRRRCSDAVEFRQELAWPRQRGTVEVEAGRSDARFPGRYRSRWQRRLEHERALAGSRHRPDRWLRAGITPMAVTSASPLSPPVAMRWQARAGQQSA